MRAIDQPRYEALDPARLPILYVVYSANPSNSGRVHSDVKKRWLAGDVEVRRGMEKIAELARLGRSVTGTQFPRLCAHQEPSVNLIAWLRRKECLKSACPEGKALLCDSRFTPLLPIQLGLPHLQRY